MRFWTLDRKIFRAGGLVILAAVLVSAWIVQSSVRLWPTAGNQDDLDAGLVETSAPDRESDEPGTPSDQFETVAGQSGTTGSDFFVDYRLEREMSRGRQVELIQSITQDQDADDGQRVAAQERLLQISRDMEQEMRLENILRARGFRDAVVFFQEDLVTVVVPAPLVEEQSTSIINLVARGAGVMAEAVMVIGQADASGP